MLSTPEHSHSDEAASVRVRVSDPKASQPTTAGQDASSSHARASAGGIIFIAIAFWLALGAALVVIGVPTIFLSTLRGRKIYVGVMVPVLATIGAMLYLYMSEFPIWRAERVLAKYAHTFTDRRQTLTETIMRREAEARSLETSQGALQGGEGASIGSTTVRFSGEDWLELAQQELKWMSEEYKKESRLGDDSSRSSTLQRQQRSLRLFMKAFVELQATVGGLLSRRATEVRQRRQSRMLGASTSRSFRRQSPSLMAAPAAAAGRNGSKGGEGGADMGSLISTAQSMQSPRTARTLADQFQHMVHPADEAQKDKSGKGTGGVELPMDEELKSLPRFSPLILTSETRPSDQTLNSQTSSQQQEQRQSIDGLLTQNRRNVSEPRLEVLNTISAKKAGGPPPATRVGHPPSKGSTASLDPKYLDLDKDLSGNEKHNGATRTSSAVQVSASTGGQSDRNGKKGDGEEPEDVFVDAESDSSVVSSTSLNDVVLSRRNPRTHSDAHLVGTAAATHSSNDALSNKNASPRVRSVSVSIALTRGARFPLDSVDVFFWLAVHREPSSQDGGFTTPLHGTNHSSMSPTVPPTFYGFEAQRGEKEGIFSCAQLGLPYKVFYVDNAHRRVLTIAEELSLDFQYCEVEPTASQTAERSAETPPQRTTGGETAGDASDLAPSSFGGSTQGTQRRRRVKDSSSYILGWKALPERAMRLAFLSVDLTVAVPARDGIADAAAASLAQKSGTSPSSPPSSRTPVAVIECLIDEVFCVLTNATVIIDVGSGKVTEVQLEGVSIEDMSSSMDSSTNGGGGGGASAKVEGSNGKQTAMPTSVTHQRSQGANRRGTIGEKIVERVRISPSSSSSF